MLRSVLFASYAKVNLDLRVLHKRDDGYHELRTIFHTISLRDQIGITFAPGDGNEVAIDSDIPDNLIVRAIEAFSAETGRRGRFEIRLRKRIPMGGGLGGGSSNAAATLLMLPWLTDTRPDEQTLQALASSLGSDVPFFLHGGAALGLGRGTELYPLPTLEALPILLVTPGIHVSTAEAYRSLQRGLTPPPNSPTIHNFGRAAWSFAGSSGPDWNRFENDFEDAVFGQHPDLRSLHEQLVRTRPLLARMSGSGSTVFAIYSNRQQAKAARAALAGHPATVATLVPATRYRRAFQRVCGVAETVWPPLSSNT
jgi:4-diphosphocytidyl-2-C-methyl-D-erythritol kinase